MTLKQYEKLAEEQNKDFCEDLCPLRLEGECDGGGKAGYNGFPIEPPCCGWDDDTDIDEQYGVMLRVANQEEERISREWKAEQERKAKNEQARKRRNESKWHVWEETREIKTLQKRIRGNVNTIHFQQSFGSAMNFANACIAGRSIDDSEPAYTEYQLGLIKENELAMARIEQLKQIKKQKFKELAEKRRKGNL